MSILVINAGSSTLKFGLFETDAACVSGWIDWSGTTSGQAELTLRMGGGEEKRPLDVSDAGGAVVQAVRVLAERAPSATMEGVAHRVVHGGVVFRASTRIDARVRTELERLVELAPLHNPPALAALRSAGDLLPGRPHVAVFDTAFFAGLPPSAHVYPLPHDWYTAWGVRRFGFHGISHAYCAERAGELLSRPDLRLVVCHLGNGCSASAVRGGEPLATTMGFTPLEGLMMGSRSGSVDPGILLHVQRRHGLTVEQLDHALNHASGLVGVSGVSSDYRHVETAACAGHERARLALAIYADRVRATIGALAVTLGGVDALVFTAGVGEHSASLRAAACTGLDCLGLRLDPARNASCSPDTDIATPDSPARILVIHTQEEQLIAREARRVLQHTGTPAA